ncbi:MAG: hypothetical protein ACKPKO_11390, partial [Candidatus Fonsibacter sp.]
MERKDMERSTERKKRLKHGKTTNGEGKVPIHGNPSNPLEQQQRKEKARRKDRKEKAKEHMERMAKKARARVTATRKENFEVGKEEKMETTEK